MASLAREQFGSYQASVFEQDVNRQFSQMNASIFQRGAEQELGALLDQTSSNYGLDQQSVDAQRYAQESQDQDWLVLGGLGSLLSGALDMLSRPQTAVAGAFLGGQSGEGVWEGFTTGLLGSPEERSDYNFATFLERAGMSGDDNKFARDFLGLALDVVVDPLNMFAFAKVRHAGKKHLLSRPWQAVERTVPGAAAAGEIAGETLWGARTRLRRAFSKFTPRIGQTEEMRLQVFADGLRRGAQKTSNAKKRLEMEEMADAIDGQGKWQSLDITDIDGVVQKTRGGLIGLKRMERNAQLNSASKAIEQFEQGLAREFRGDGGPDRAKAFVHTIKNSESLQNTMAELMYRAKGFEGGVLGTAVMREAEQIDDARKLIKRRGAGVSGESFDSFIDSILSHPLTDAEAAERGLKGLRGKGYRGARTDEAAEILARDQGVSDISQMPYRRAPGYKKGDKLLSEEDARQQMEFNQNVRTLHDLGLTNYVRYIQGEFGQVSAQADQLVGLLETMSTGALATSMGVLTKESLYHRVMVPTRKELTQFLNDSPGIRRMLSRKGMAFDTNASLQELVDQGMNLDVFAVVAYDLASTRSNAIAFQLFDTEFMRALGFRSYDKKQMARRMDGLLKRIQIIQARALPEGAEKPAQRRGLMEQMKQEIYEGRRSPKEAVHAMMEDVDAPMWTHRTRGDLGVGAGRRTVLGRGEFQERTQLYDELEAYFNHVPVPGETQNHFGDDAAGLVHGIHAAAESLEVNHNYANDALRLEEGLNVVDEARRAANEEVGEILWQSDEALPGWDYDTGWDTHRAAKKQQAAREGEVRREWPRGAPKEAPRQPLPEHIWDIGPGEAGEVLRPPVPVRGLGKKERVRLQREAEEEWSSRQGRWENWYTQEKPDELGGKTRQEAATGWRPKALAVLRAAGLRKGTSAKNTQDGRHSPLAPLGYRQNPKKTLASDKNYRPDRGDRTAREWAADDPGLVSLDEVKVGGRVLIPNPDKAPKSIQKYYKRDKNGNVIYRTAYANIELPELKSKGRVPPGKVQKVVDLEAGERRGKAHLTYEEAVKLPGGAAWRHLAPSARHADVRNWGRAFAGGEVGYDPTFALGKARSTRDEIWALELMGDRARKGIHDEYLLQRLASTGKEFDPHERLGRHGNEGSATQVWTESRTAVVNTIRNLQAKVLEVGTDEQWSYYWDKAPALKILKGKDVLSTKEIDDLVKSAERKVAVLDEVKYKKDNPGHQQTSAADAAEQGVHEPPLRTRSDIEGTPKKKRHEEEGYSTPEEMREAEKPPGGLSDAEYEELIARVPTDVLLQRGGLTLDAVDMPASEVAAIREYRGRNLRSVESVETVSPSPATAGHKSWDEIKMPQEALTPVERTGFGFPGRRTKKGGAEGRVSPALQPSSYDARPLDKAPDVITGPDEVMRAYSMVSNPATMSAFLRVLDTFNSFWKPLVTVLPTNVSYFTRNLAGLVFLGLTTGGMSPVAMGKWNSRAAQLQKMGAFDRLPEEAKRMPSMDELRNRWLKGNADPAQPMPSNTDLEQGWIKDMAEEHLSVTYSFSTEAIEQLARRGVARDGINLATLSPEEESVALANWVKANMIDTGTLKRGTGAGHATEGIHDLQDLTQTIKYSDLERIMDARGVVGGGHREASRIDLIEGEGMLARTQRRIAKRAAAWTGQNVPETVKSREAFQIATDEYFESWFKRHVGYNPIRMGGTVAMAMDDNFKIGGFLYRVFEKGDTLDDAAAFVRKTFYNYDEVGEWTKTAAGVLPFARWSRLNIPRMVELTTQPRQWWKIDKLGMGPLSDQYEKDTSDFESTTLPDWILERHHVVLGQRPDGSTRVLYGLGLPIEDLNKLFARSDRATLDNLAAEVGPILRIPVEGWQDRSFFTGEPISDPGVQNYYRRAFAIIDKLQIGEPGEDGWKSPLNLKNWLQVERIERPDGRITYTSGNPTAMYVLGALIGRPLGMFSKAVEMYDASEDGSRPSRMWDMTTGLKIREVFPPPYEGVPLAQRTIDNPQLAALVDQYYSIPIFGREHMSAEESIQAFAGYNMARSMATSLRRLAMSSGADIDEDDAMDAAFTRVGLLFPYGNRETLARRVWSEKIPQRGRSERIEFIRRNPILELAIKELSPDDIAWMLGELDHRDIPAFLR